MTSSTVSSATPDAPVGFLDSGVGGLPYLARVREILPDERFVYLADRANFPFGERPRAEVREIVLAAVSRLIEAAHPRLVVVACNTASVVSLAELRNEFSLPFVGVVPAIKTASESRPGGRIAVLATERTVEDPYVSSLVNQFAASSEILLVPAGGLVRTIETRLALAPEVELREALTPSLRRIVTERADSVVLGCTHFVHIRGLLADMLGEGIPVLDSVEGVARQTARVRGTAAAPGARLGKSGDPGSGGASSVRSADVLIVTGGDPGENYRRLAATYALDLQIHG